MPVETPARLLGAHMPATGGLHKALLSGKEIGCTAVQIFTRNPRQWTPGDLEPEAVDAYLAAREETGIEFVAAHDSYLINLAAPDAGVLEQSRDAFRGELARAEALRIPWVVTHMGCHLESGEETGLRVLCESLTGILRDTESLCAGVALETTAGQGTGLGYTFEQIARILDGCAHHPRMGVCLDTCHIFAAGYDIRGDEEYERVLADFGATIGFEKLRLIHANDAKKPLGSRVDRHEHVGRGHIGLPAFARLVTDPRLLAIPVVIETPDAETMHAVNLARLRRLAAGEDPGMRVTVRFFGHYSDFAMDGEQVELPTDATVTALGQLLGTRDVRLAGIERVCRAAVNEEYAEPGCILHDGDEVAFIPPMSGG